MIGCGCRVILGPSAALIQVLSVHMKRKLEDAGDKAQHHHMPGSARISLDRIGYWPGNRGGLGISSHHVHEVAHDCNANRTKLQRYGHVALIEIPTSELQTIRDANRARCEGDDLMPRYAETIQYVCATKTHFVHAQKLAKDGGRTLYNQGNVKTRWQDADSEGAQILDQGPLCIIYKAELLLDIDATNALSGEDNLNASVQFGEDEMQAFARVDEITTRLAPSQAAGKAREADGTITIGVVLASLQVSGLWQILSRGMDATYCAALVYTQTTCINIEDLPVQRMWWPRPSARDGLWARSQA